MSGRSIQRVVASVFIASMHFMQVVHAQQPQRNQAPDEKGAFITAAMNHVKIEIQKSVSEMAKRGIQPMMGPPPNIVPFGDWDYYYLDDFPLVWQPNPGENFKPVRVPKGFVSDLTSVPRIFWSALPRQGRYAYAAIVHDYLYWVQDRSRQEADRILAIAMADSKVERKVIRTIYNGVRLAGQASWNENARLKAAGEKRILKQFPTDFTISWSDWKKRPGVFAD